MELKFEDAFLKAFCSDGFHSSQPNKQGVYQ